MVNSGKSLATRIILLFIILSGSSLAAAETYYRWTDERGNPVHSDRPPPKGTSYDVVSTESSLIRPVEPEAGAVPKKLKSTPTNEFQTVETKSPMMEKNPAYCARARENLNLIDTSPRVKLRDDQGEVRFLSEEEKADARRQALDAIEAYCE